MTALHLAAVSGASAATVRALMEAFPEAARTRDNDRLLPADYALLHGAGEDAGVALRGLFIISPEGKLRQITVNDLPVGRSVDEVLRLVTAFQYTDEHGEVCPANWKPGAKTMIDDPEKSQAYFSTLS